MITALYVELSRCRDRSDIEMLEDPLVLEYYYFFFFSNENMFYSADSITVIKLQNHSMIIHTLILQLFYIIIV